MTTDLPPSAASAAVPGAGAGPARVRKRNGRLQPFDLLRIRRALARLTEAIDSRGEDLVQSWLDALQAQLRRREESVLPTADLHRLVYEIIAASGQSALADRWRQYADRKQKLRARIAAAPPRLPGLEPARERLDRPIGFVRAEWQQRLVQAGVDGEAAETLSRDLAQLVLNIDPELLTAALVAALTRSLCLARGITVLPADIPLAGVTPAELDEAYYAPASSPAAVPATSTTTAAAGMLPAAAPVPADPPETLPPIWRESWALERFYPEEVRFFHRLGYWRLGLTEHPWGLWSLRVDTHRIAVPASRQGSPEACGLKLAQILAGLCRWTAETVIAQGVGEFIQRCYSQETLRAAMLRAFSIALAALLSEHRQRADAGPQPARLILRLGTPQHVSADEALLKQMNDLGFDRYEDGLELEIPPRALQRMHFQKYLFAAWSAGIPIHLTAARPTELCCLAPVGIRLNADTVAPWTGSASATTVEPTAAAESAAGDSAIEWAHEFFDTNADDLLWALEAHRRHLAELVESPTAEQAGTRFAQWAARQDVLGYFQAQLHWSLAVTPLGLSDPLASGRYDAALWQKLMTLPERLAGWQGLRAEDKAVRAKSRRFHARLLPEDCTGFAIRGRPDERAAICTWSDESLERLPGFLQRYAERAALIDQATPLNLLARVADSRMALEDGRSVLDHLAETWPEAAVRVLSPAMAAREIAAGRPRGRFGRLYELDPLRLAITQPAATPRLF